MITAMPVGSRSTTIPAGTPTAATSDTALGCAMVTRLLAVMT